MASVGSSILTSLGAGTIDTASLVSGLVSATREPRETVIASKQTLNNARISALASATSSLDTFADALGQVLAGAEYTGQPMSNNSNIASVSLLSGGTPAGLPAQLTVKSLASARVLSSAPVGGASATTEVGTGSLTITPTNGDDPVTITIDSTNNSFAGLADAINKADTGVTATVVTDTQGTRLVFKGQTGAANDFSVSVSPADGGSTLAGMATLTSSSLPQNAQITLDGIDYEYASNSIDGAIPYMRIELNKADENSTVTLSMTQPTATMKDLLKEFVDAYNTLMKALNTASATGTDSSNAGVLNGVASVRDMKKQLSQLTSTALATTGTYRTLADIGIGTNRDGTLKLDTAQLDKAMAADPEGIARMINPTTSTADNPGLSRIMDTVRDNIQKDDGPLKLAQKRYTEMASDLSDELDKLDEQMTSYQAQLQSVYSKMETRLNAFKATQSYLEQQIAVWNNSDN